ncbi:MAG: hypothetical protein WA104_03065 [Thermodesulfovibrionales bacterium]
MIKLKKLIRWWDGLIIFAFFLFAVNFPKAGDAWITDPVGSIIVIWVIIVVVRVILRKTKEAFKRGLEK